MPLYHDNFRNLTRAGYLAIFASGILATSCSRSGSSASTADLTARLESLREKVAAAEKENAELEQAKQAAETAREEAKNSIGEQVQASADLDVQRIKLGEELSKIRGEFDSYKAKYRAWARSAAKGHVFTSIDTGDGNTLTNAKITSLNATTVGLTTASAIKAIPLEQLSPKLRDQLGYDPSAAAGEGLSVMQKAEIEIDQAQEERAQQSKRFKEMLRERNRLLDQEDAMIAENLTVPKELSDRIDELQIDLKLCNDRSAQLIRIMNWNIRLINNGGTPPPGPRPH